LQKGKKQMRNDKALLNPKCSQYIKWQYEYSNKHNDAQYLAAHASALPGEELNRRQN
jgi:hypothetical protein